MKSVSELKQRAEDAQNAFFNARQMTPILIGEITDICSKLLRHGGYNLREHHNFANALEEELTEYAIKNGK